MGNDTEVVTALYGCVVAYGTTPESFIVFDSGCIVIVIYIIYNILYIIFLSLKC